MVLRHTAVVAIALFTLVVSVHPSSASVVLSDSLGDWQSKASQTGGTVDFSSFAPTPGTYTPEAPSLSVPGAVFTSPGSNVSVMNPSAGQPWYQWSDAGAVLMSVNNVSHGSIRIDLTSALTALGVYVMVPELLDNVYVPSQVTLQVGNGAVILWEGALATPAKPDKRFVGLTASESFNWIAFSPSGVYTVIDDVRFGEAFAIAPPGGGGGGEDPQPTPEPWVFFTVGSGLIALRFRKAWVEGRS